MDGKEFRHFAYATPGETPRGGPAQVPGTQR
jgi:hypothetical protein